MNVTVQTKTYALPPVDRAEALRYAGCPGADGELEEILENSIELINEKLSPRVCWSTLPVTLTGKRCDFGAFSVDSADLAESLSGCTRAVVFAATVGVDADRLIIRYGRLLPSRGVMLSAVADERIEALCDEFCSEFGSVRPRFSPGYGDLPLETQQDIFALLNCEKHIGLTLNQSLLMSPTKSVTAIFGLE